MHTASRVQFSVIRFLTMVPGLHTPTDVAPDIYQPKARATEPPRTTDRAAMSKTLNRIGSIRLSYGPSILFLHPTEHTSGLVLAFQLSIQKLLMS